MPDKIQDAFKKALRERATDGKITCHEARELAEKAGVEYSEMGAACNELGIRIHSCELGCF